MLQLDLQLLTQTGGAGARNSKKFLSTQVRQNEIKTFEFEKDYEIGITKFSDTLTKSL